MRDGGRIAAAIEVLEEVELRHRPVSVALRDWGAAHRFAGSGDRAAIGNLLYDALRNRKSLALAMGNDAPRSAVLGVYGRLWGHKSNAIDALFVEDKFAPDRLTDKEHAGIDATVPDDAPAHLRADLPEWIWSSFEADFDNQAMAEARAFAQRPPLDLRVNTLKSSRDKVLKALAKQKAKQTAIARHGMRIEAGKGPARLPNVQAEPGFQKGWFEVQDEGSQIAADLVFPQAGEQVLDFCAGAGGKTLALAAAMENKGQVHAYDADKTRLAPIFERLKRAGTRNVQVHEAGADIANLHDRFDRVVVDAPCTGSGTWRRHPDAKWRLTPDQLETRTQEQAAILDEASQFVRPGGYLCYITCSVLSAENEDQVYAFGDRNPGWALLSAGEVWQDLFGFDKAQPWSSDMNCVTLTPAATGTDGFFFAVMQREEPA